MLDVHKSRYKAAIAETRNAFTQIESKYMAEEQTRVSKNQISVCVFISQVVTCNRRGPQVDVEQVCIQKSIHTKVQQSFPSSESVVSQITCQE
jgi:hypothetical protein